MKNNFNMYFPEGYSEKSIYCIGEVKLSDIGLCKGYVFSN